MPDSLVASSVVERRSVTWALASSKMSQELLIQSALTDLTRQMSSMDTYGDLCLTFEVRDITTKGKPYWLQVTEARLNMQYLDEEEPTTCLPKEVTVFPKAMKLVCWESCVFATFEISFLFHEGLAILIDRIFRQYFALGEDYSISTKIEHL
jgi:hypothetical protein